MAYRTAALTFAGVLIGFKLWSVLLIYMFSSEGGTTAFLLGTHVLWILVPIALLWAPVLFWYRLIRTRRRRRELERAEWHVEERPPAQR